MAKLSIWRQSLAVAILFLSAFAARASGPEILGHLPNTQACRQWKAELTSPPLSVDAPAGTLKPLQTDQVSVRDAKGRLLYSWSDGKYHRSTPHALWSVSKSISAVLVGTAIQDGKLHLDDSLVNYLPRQIVAEAADRKQLAAVKISQLLAMTSGIEWSEAVDLDPVKVSVLPLMYGSGAVDFTRGVLTHSFVAHPGRVWNYSSANATLEWAALKTVYGGSGAKYDDMPYQNLFRPLGLKSARFEQDGTGTYLGAQYIYLSADDLSTLGTLIINDGVTASGQRLIPTGWTKMAGEFEPTSIAHVKTKADFVHFSPYSKGGFWLNRQSPAGQYYPHGPADMLYAEGLLGQWLMIMPSQGLVLARTGHDMTAPIAQVDSVVEKTVRCFGGAR